MLRRRYRQIVFFFGRLLISLAFWEIILPRLGLRVFTARGREDRLKRAAVDFRKLAIRMGGVMIKVGQFLSTRMDVLPDVIIRELSGLQDEVPPEEFSALQQVAETDFGMSLEEKYACIDPQPMAAASLGQVHRACYHALDETHTPDVKQNVVVKIQRPGIEQIVATDLAALRTVGKWLNRYRPIRRRADIQALQAEFSRILYEELDYIAEGANVEKFADNFRGFSGVRVPHVIWTATTRRVLTLEDVSGIKITDYESIEAAGINRAEVASRLLDTYLKQIFEDGFFHADPHPGNLFVYPVGNEPNSSGSWVLTFIDFGMVGRIPNNTRQALREMLVGVGTRDSARIIKSYQMLNILLPSADLKLLESAEERLFERFWGKNMTELKNTSLEDVNQLLREFGQLIYEMPFQLPHDLIFLGRTVAILSGMCTGLDPQFNVWQHLSPFAQKLVSEEISTGAAFWLKEIQDFLICLVTLPGRASTVLEKMERGEFVVRNAQMDTQMQHLQKEMNRTWKAIYLLVLLLAGLLIVQIWQVFFR